MKFTRASSLPAKLLAAACALSCGWAQNTTTPKTRPPPTPEQLRLRAFVNSRRKLVEGLKPTDDCTRLLQAVESGRVKLDNTDLRSLTQSVLQELKIPVSSQLLVFSGSASQGTRVNPRNPRAIYFNDECYVGIVPGGLLEMIGVDAAAGATLYTFQKVGTKSPPTAIANDGCMGCHGGSDSGYAPGFFMRFCLPEMSGKMTGIINAVEGHERPLEDRFGGWFVTSLDQRAFPSAGMVMKAGVAVPTRIGELFDPGLHLAQKSDILAHLLHEHQIGFHNRLIKALMSAHDNGQAEGARMLPSHEEDIDEVIRYMLFRGEAPLPAGGVTGDPRYMEDFRRNRRPSRTGASLKDLDLKTRLLKYRCSYMIYTRPWLEMPAEVKAELITRLHRALQSPDDPLSDHLPEFERLQILRILRDTLPGLPDDW
ncbi:MAG: hypothetical protein JNN17_08415 [Verrucomicrobiaceae bacterium]|nr:hypothetical protein [Verrucomicrobiaceae bacterium]